MRFRSLLPPLFNIAKPQRSHICCVYRYHLLRISSSKTLRLLGLRCCLMVNHKDIQVTSRVLEELYESYEMPLARRSFFCGTPATCAERECLIVWKRVLMRMEKMCSCCPLANSNARFLVMQKVQKWQYINTRNLPFWPPKDHWCL